MQKDDLFASIKSRATKIDNMDELRFGQLVLTGLSTSTEYNFDSAVGFICQVRKGASDAGEDVVLLRHSNGELVCHLAQVFLEIPENLVLNSLAHFSRGIDVELVENPELTYMIGEHLPESGFIIPIRPPVSIDI